MSNAPAWIIPEPREDVIHLLAWAILLSTVDDEAAALRESRHAWTTGVERRAAYQEAIPTLEAIRDAAVAEREHVEAALHNDDSQPGDVE